jgi:lipopolysaccharide/colanic/teichoic acid biosynthesis glycosyltransferase
MQVLSDAWVQTTEAESALLGPFEGVKGDVEPGRRRYAILKRFIDGVSAAMLLLILSPVMVLIVIGITLTSGGPVLFRQRRLGRHGKPFVLLKFRTMFTGSWDADHLEIVRQQIFSTHARRKEKKPFRGSERRKTDFKCIPKERITPIGHLLRKVGLDELPQLWNVLKGEMSLVGPRPPIPYELRFRTDEQKRRLAALPGLTGLWQASGWSQLNYAEMMQIDFDYIERQSLWLDTQILLRTPFAILMSRIRAL